MDYELLDRVRRQGEWEAWVDFFLEGVEHTALGAVQTARRLDTAFLRPGAHAWRDGCFREYRRTQEPAGLRDALVLSLATSLTHSRTHTDLPAKIAAQRSKPANGAHQNPLSFCNNV